MTLLSRGLSVFKATVSRSARRQTQRVMWHSDTRGCPPGSIKLVRAGRANSMRSISSSSSVKSPSRMVGSLKSLLGSEARFEPITNNLF